MKRHYIQVHLYLYQQKRGVVLNYAIPPPWNVLHVSMQKPLQDLLKILLQDHHPRNKFSKKTISSLAIAFQPTIIFLPSLVKSHTRLARNKAVIHVAAYLLIAQVVRFTTFPNIQPMLLKLSKNTLWLEALAMEEGFKVKEYDSDNRIFSSTEFKEYCTRFGHHCCRQTSQHQLNIEVDTNILISTLIYWIWLPFDSGIEKWMRNATCHLDGMVLLNPRCWRGERLHHHGGGVCWLFVLCENMWLSYLALYINSLL